MKDPNHHARLAARKCFKPYLSEEQLSQAIRILEQGHQIDSTISLIAYVKKVATEFGIDETTRKSLHSQLHQLLQSPLTAEDEPIDAMPPKKPQPSDSVTEPATANAAAITTPTAEAPQPPEQPKVELPPHVALFALLVQQIGEACPLLELLKLVNDIVDSKNPLSQRLIRAIKQWQQQTDSFDWAIALDESVLIALVHTLYTAVCELLGPVEADHLFHQALTLCEKQPEAKLFSPSRFF